jgi:hypothetical protein
VREDGKAKATGGEGEEGEVELENLWRRRTRLLAKAVGASVKLGELHADEHILEPEESQARLSWAVETALKELARRTKEGEKEVEGAWMSREEIGGALEGKYLSADYHVHEITSNSFCSIGTKLREKLAVPTCCSPLLPSTSYVRVAMPPACP